MIEFWTCINPHRTVVSVVLESWRPCYVTFKIFHSPAHHQHLVPCPCNWGTELEGEVSNSFSRIKSNFPQSPGLKVIFSRVSDKKRVSWNDKIKRNSHKIAEYTFQEQRWYQVIIFRRIYLQALEHIAHFPFRISIFIEWCTKITLGKPRYKKKTVKKGHPQYFFLAQIYQGLKSLENGLYTDKLTIKCTVPILEGDPIH